MESVLIAKSSIATNNASKYLKWLCGHFKIKTEAQYDDQHGHIMFEFGTCDMQANPDSLFIHVQANDEESFTLIKDVVGGHLERFAHKEAIKVIWQDQTKVISNEA